MSRAPGPAERVLAVLPSWLGDLVQCEPALRALCRHVGEERVSLAADGHLLRVLDGAFRAAPRLPHAQAAAARVRAWRGHDLALLFPGSFRSAWTAWRACIPRRVGWSRDGRGWLLSDGGRPALERGGTPLGLGRAGRGRRILPRPFGATCVELVGRIGVSVGDTRPRLRVDPEGVARAEERLARHAVAAGEPCILASVGSRPGSAKALPAAAWARALACLARAGAPPALLCGGPGEETVVEEVRAACAAEGVAAAVLTSPAPDLAELGALCARASLVLCADGGVRHVAQATGASVLWVAGPTDPRHSADHLERQVLLRTPVPCGPCHRERCPISGAGRHACMRRLDPEELAARALAQLQ